MLKFLRATFSSIYRYGDPVAPSPDTARALWDRQTAHCATFPARSLINPEARLRASWPTGRGYRPRCCR